MANSISKQYPNYYYILDLVGQDRLDYLNKLANLYNNLKSKGYPVPSATIVGSDDASYVEFELMAGDSISNLIKAGTINGVKGNDLTRRIVNVVRDIKSREDGIVLYNQHQSNVSYDPETDEICLCDLIQNSSVTDFRRVRKPSPEYAEELKKMAEERRQRIRSQRA